MCPGSSGELAGSTKDDQGKNDAVPTVGNEPRDMRECIRQVAPEHRIRRGAEYWILNKMVYASLNPDPYTRNVYRNKGWIFT